MKVSQLLIVFAVAAQIVSVENSQAKLHFTKSSKKIRETILTKNKEAIKDPYYKLKLAKVEELSDEESLKYELNQRAKESTQEIMNKDFNPNKDIKIPNGVPGINNDDFAGANNRNSAPITNRAAPVPGAGGGLAVGTGVGGSTVTNPGLGGITGVLDGVLLIVDKLVAIGQKIIPTIEKGKAVVTNNPMAAISVIPNINTKDPVVHEMGNWSIPYTKRFRITYQNGFGMDVVSFVYSVTFQHGGTYGGKGHYLAGVRMAAQDIMINWGFDLDATSQLIQISNVGTEEDVIAGATLEMSYTVKNWTRTLSTSEYFHVTGDGRLFRL